MKYLKRSESIPEIDIPEDSIIQFCFPEEEDLLVYTGKDMESPIENSKNMEKLIDNLSDNLKNINYSNLTISCKNVYYNNTSVKINYEYEKEFIDYNDNIIKTSKIKGSVTSEEFPENNSYENYQERIITFSIKGLNASTTIIQGVKSDISTGSKISIGNYRDLIISAENVSASKTFTNINYQFKGDYITETDNTVKTNSYSGNTISSSFAKNTSSTETVKIPINFSINGLSESTTITQNVYIPSDLIVGTNIIDNSDTTKTQYTFSNRTGRLYLFIAPETTTYTFLFNDNVDNGSAIDTYGYMFNEDDLNSYIAYNDDSGGNSDPKWSYSCISGNLYYILIAPYSQSSTVNVKGILTISK